MIIKVIQNGTKTTTLTTGNKNNNKNNNILVQLQIIMPQ